MRLLRFAVLAPAIVCITPLAAIACLWDYDTLRQERERFPGVLELITGKFLRHSKEFYEWRIEDRKKKLATDPTNLALLDDLAVAYEKVGNHAKAIEIAQAEEKIEPIRYETFANLGTFYILAGDLSQGLGYIKKALAVNPDAHFGRERYQMWLVEYMLEKQRNGKTVLPLQKALGEKEANKTARDFNDFVRQKMGIDGPARSDMQKAVMGVLGMMRFANYDNPVLLESLGDLLKGSPDPDIDAKRLAARCYLQASYQAKDDKARSNYRQLASYALSFQTRTPLTNDQLSLDELERDFTSELEDARSWYGQLAAREKGWIREGKDADAEFDRLYTTEPVAAGVDQIEDSDLPGVAIAGGAIILAVAAVWLLWRRRKRRKQFLKQFLKC